MILSVNLELDFTQHFMVADKVTVISKALGSEEAYKWESEGADGYTIQNRMTKKQLEQKLY